MKTLKDVMPIFFETEFNDVEAYKYKDVKVKEEFFGHTARPWIGNHKNVHYWCLLENGKAVGWNENPSKGSSFPVAVYKEYMSVLGKGSYSIVYSLGDKLCIKRTKSYKKDAFYKLMSLSEKIRNEHKIVPVYQVGVSSKKEAFYVLKKLFPIEFSYNDIQSLKEFNDYHVAVFEDQKLKEICLIAKEILNHVVGCELDIQSSNIMQDNYGNYFLTDPIVFIS